MMENKFRFPLDLQLFAEKGKSGNDIDPDKALEEMDDAKNVDDETDDDLEEDEEDIDEEDIEDEDEDLDEDEDSETEDDEDLKEYIDYFGKNERESRIWTDFYNTFEYWGQYNIRPDKDTNMSVAQALDLLKNNASIFNQKHSHEMDAYHFRRAELSQNFLKLLLYEDSAECSKMKAADFSEYADIISSTDPNEPLVTGCALINRWCYNVLNSMEGDDIFERSLSWKIKILTIIKMFWMFLMFLKKRH